MGAKQDLENVIRASDLLKDGSTIRIFLVGHGNQELKIRNLCLGKRNIAVYPAVSNEDYPTLLATADLLLVNERSSQMEMSLPSKLTSYLFSERPVIAAVPRNGASWKFLNGLAELVEAGEPLALARAIESLSENPERLQILAKQGKFFAEAHLNPEIAREKYLGWVKSLLNS
jgi:glycosyltransferase involved in cell wall biosynthesis